jgi:uncharacterized damage-inducible protein DinB
MERPEPPYEADERTTLTSFLDWQRATLAWKCEGLTDEQLRQRNVEPSPISLLGLVRHMTDVERGWFRRTLVGEDAPALTWTAEDNDGDFNQSDTADVTEAFAAWNREIEIARANVAATASLDVTGTNRDGTKISLRWILTHMIEEYARHNGHADFLRERIDGATGE